MQRFYFDVFVGLDANLDADGHEVGNLRAAEIEARRTAGEIARDRLLKLQDATPEGIRVEVKNEHRQHVLTVTVSLCVERRAHNRGTGRQLAAASQTSEARVRILLVEDETPVSINTGMILEDEGFTVDYAYNGRDALAKAKASPPDLIITDYMMPHMDGLAMITNLRSDGWTGPIVLTTSTMEDRLPVSYPRGHDGYLAKPHREEDLLILVRALLTQTQDRA